MSVLRFLLEAAEKPGWAKESRPTFIPALSSAPNLNRFKCLSKTSHEKDFSRLRVKILLDLILFLSLPCKNMLARRTGNLNFGSKL